MKHSDGLPEKQLTFIQAGAWIVNAKKTEHKIYENKNVMNTRNLSQKETDRCE